MTSTTDRRRTTGDRAEAAVTEELSALGFTVTNLNDLVGNCPFADLLACKGATRVLVQVKGTETEDGKFGTPPGRVRALEVISTGLSCHAIYAFVHLLAGNRVIRYATAAGVAVLAEEEEAAYTGVNRYHVTIDQFTADAGQLDSLLREAPEGLSDLTTATREGPFWEAANGRAPLPPAAVTLGWELVAISPEEGTIEVAFTATDAFLNPAGAVQGGFLAAMLDDTMGPALVAGLEPGDFAPTTDLHVQFLRPARPGRVTGRGRVVRRGRDVAFLAGELVDEQGVVLAVATATAQIRSRMLER